MSVMTTRRALTLAGAVAVLAVAALVAWSMSSGAPDAGAASFARTITLNRQEIGGQVAALARQAPQEQAAALRDRSVDLGEYRAAVGATVRCVRQQATTAVNPGTNTVVLHGPTVSPDSFQVAYSYEVLGPLTDPSAMEQVEKACQERFQRQVEQAYQLSKLADPAFMDAQAGRFQRCVSAAGVAVNWARGSAAVGALERARTVPDQREPIYRCLAEAPSVNAALAAR